MLFTDITIIQGEIVSSRVWDTRELAESALVECRRMLALLRKGEEFVQHSLRGLPKFGVSLGPPAWLIETMGERAEAPGRFFCTAEPGKPPFQINFILPAVADVHYQDAIALCTLVGLSGIDPHEWAEERLQEMAERVLEMRPVLATTIMPTYPLDRNVVMVASDFSTCFAAVLLLESED